MARVKTSAIIADISGKLNGSVFQRNQGGLCIRNQSGKINSNTLRSNSRKVGMSVVQGAWQSLTAAERLLWETYSVYLSKKQKHSNSLIINGHQLFLNINSIRYDLSSSNALFQPYLLSTPILQPLPQPINVSLIVINFGDITVTLDRAVDATKEVVVLFLSRPLSGSQQSAHQKLILMKSPTINGTDFIVTDYYEEVYGRILNVGEYVQSKVAIYNTDSENYSSYSVQRVLVS